MAASLVEQTYNRLLDMIIKKEYRPGDRLPSEMVLCEEFEVSRNTLRAALNKLAALGFTETRKGGGTYVKAVDSDVYLNFFIPALLTHNVSLLEMMRFRKGIEVEAARQAAKEATPEDIEQLRGLLNRCRELNEDVVAFASADTEFHTCIAKASGNKMLEKITEIIWVMILSEMKNFLVAQGETIDSLFYHDMVFRCIAEGKSDEAAYLMERHMALITERVKKYVAAGGNCDRCEPLTN
ncbi:FadR family transcriptional regulator [Clostridiaceae bacterium]|nr:FadR family transcriptional regulator [Clostridiaceae bacterium]RKI18023.1 FadR family transcriptional regulator [bacterium 1XD21-70]